MRRLVQGGGGNSTSLTCNGVSNSGAKQLTNLTETLLKCETEIRANCDPSNLPQPNATELTKCNAACDIFKNKTETCVKKSGSEACTCWSSSDLTSSSKIVKTCDRKFRFMFVSFYRIFHSVQNCKNICQGTEEVYRYFWKMQKIRR